jgi:NAD-dependent epimerase/dehydratase family protein
MQIVTSHSRENLVTARRIGILGATSVVAEYLTELLPAHYQPLLFSRSIRQDQTASVTDASVPFWISVMPIWAMPNYFDLLSARGARRVIAVSSTSRFTKTESPIESDRVVAEQLAEGERVFVEWASAHGVEFLILRSTLIYGRGRDLNLSRVAHLIARFGFFPIVGGATGKRQPLHAADLARACIQALEAENLTGKAYEVSGGETLSYYEMVGRIFDALGKPRRFVWLPMPIFTAVMSWARLMRGLSHLTPGMARRMNEDLVFDHTHAVRDFGFAPRPFRPAVGDLLTAQPTVKRVAATAVRKGHRDTS